MSLMKRIVNMCALVLLVLPLVVKAEISLPDTVAAVQEVVTDYQMLDGHIEVVNKSTVSAQTAGVISKLNYDVGDYVVKGKLIARISSQDQKSGVLEAKASVDQSVASISSANAAVSGANATISGALASMKEAQATIARANATISQAKASTKEAHANYVVARSEFERVKGLYAKRILTKSQYDQAEAAMRSSLARVESAKARQKSTEAERVAALSRVNSAKANISSAKAALSSSKANLTSAKARLNSSKANLSKAGQQLGYTEVIAPYSGIVTERHVELGEVISPGKPIMTGISLKQMRAVADIPQSLFVKVSKHHSARLFVADDKQGTPINKLTFFPYADPASNAFKVRASIDGKVKGLFPGIFVKIGFEIGKEEQLVVPLSAVAYRSEVTGVYVVNEKGEPSLRQVLLGQVTADNKIRVLAGLSVGEMIATDPVHAAVYLKHLRQIKNEKAKAAEENSHE